MFQNQPISQLVTSRYKNNSGKPIVLTPGQLEIFSIIAGKQHTRTHCMAYTRYGKSFSVGLGVLTRASTYAEKWAIIAPSSKKAKIIMGVIIDHIFDCEYTASKFDMKKDESREKIKRERNKEKINFRISNNRLGEIFILSTEGKRTKDVLDAVMGFGAPNIVLDESGLIDNVPYIGVKRMLGDAFKYEDTFLFEVGNPFKRNHFLKTSNDSDYHHINIPYQQGIKEERTDPKHIEEMKKDSDPITFGILYENQFPQEDQIDMAGYLPLITEQELENAIVDKVQHFGNTKIGVDVACGGTDYSVIIRRSEKFAEITLRDRSDDTTVLAANVLALRNRLTVPISLSSVSVMNPIVEVDIDNLGVGQGAYDILRGQIGRVYGVINGSIPQDTTKFYNKKAENYWRLREWILSGGKLFVHPAWKELLDIKWTRKSDRKIAIISKKELRQKGVPSPDVADALANSFQNPDKTMNEMQAEATYPEEISNKDII